MVSQFLPPLIAQRLRAGAGLLLASCFLAAAHPVTDQESDELKDLLQELRQLRQSYYLERDDQAAAIDAARDTVFELRSDVKGLAQKRAEQQQNESELGAEIETLKAEELQLETQESEALRAIKGLGQAARVHVEAAVPCRVDLRLRKLDAFAEATTARDAFGSLWSFCEEELRAARSGETYTDEVDLPDGRTKHARFVRVGLHFLGFVSEDGQDVGMWMPAKGWVTGEALSLEDTEAIRTAVEILDQRRGPAHVNLRMALGGSLSK